MKGDHVAQRAGIRRSAKAVAAVADVLLVRAGDPLFQRIVSVRFARIDIVPTVRYLELGNGAAAMVGIGLVPHRDISIGKTLRVIHDTLLGLVRPHGRNVVSLRGNIGGPRTKVDDAGGQKRRP